MVINGNLSYSDDEVMVFEFLKGLRKEHTEPELHKNRFHLIQKFEDGIPVSENNLNNKSEQFTPILRKSKMLWLSEKLPA